MVVTVSPVDVTPYILNFLLFVSQHENYGFVSNLSWKVIVSVLIMMHTLSLNGNSACFRRLFRWFSQQLSVFHT